MKLKRFMDKHYKGNSLVPGFYHKWDVGFHLELGKEIYQLDENGRINMEMFYTVYEQVSEIFPYLFKSTDDVFMVVNSYPNETKKVAYPNLFKRYIKQKNLKYSLHGHNLYWHFDDDKLLVQQMELFCKVSDIKLEHLFKAIIHEDFYSLRPRLRKKHSIYAPDVFLININTKCIFHLYDDRGCEIINADIKLHEQLLDTFKSWEKQAKP